MTASFKMRRVISSTLLLSLLAPLSVAQPKTRLAPRLLLEIRRTDIMGFYIENRTMRVFSDGRCVAEGELMKGANKHGLLRKVSVRVETRLGEREVAELVNLAEQPEFQDAHAEYTVPITRAYPSWVTITYRNRGREKSVRVSNLNRKDVSKAARDVVPSPLLKLVEEIDVFLD